MRSTEVIFPVDIITASQFLVFLRDQGYSKFSIKLGLMGLKWANSFFPQSPKLDDPFIQRILSSASRNIPSKKNQKCPLSKELLAKILDIGQNASLTEIRDALILSLSFSLLLRNDELRHLACSHVERKPDGLVFKIVSSKTDVFRNGKQLFLAKQTDGFSVVNLLERYLLKANLRLGTNVFLFGPVGRNAIGDPIIENVRISYECCRSIFKAQVEKHGLDPRKYGTHSARSGGASTLAPKVSPFELQLSGRWADARSLRNYVEVPDSRRFEISKNLFIPKPAEENSQK